MVLQRSRGNLEGEGGRIMGDIGDAKERIARSHEQINGVKKTAIKTTFEQMHEVRGELVDVRERMVSRSRSATAWCVHSARDDRGPARSIWNQCR